MAAENKEEPEEEEEEEEVPQPSFKLSYFPFAGRAASLRMTAYIGGLSYTDEFVTSDEHKKSKEGGLRRWSGLPELTVYDKNNKELCTIGQSNACLRYIGILSGLYSDKPLIASLIDEILDSVEDTKRVLQGAMSTKEDRAKLISKEGALTYWLTKFENRLSENEKRGNENGFTVGNTMTIADTKLFELLHGVLLVFESYEDIPKDFISQYPKIQNFYQTVNSDEKVEEFIQKFTLRHSEFKMDPTDDDIKMQTYKGTFMSG
eukprot:475962_1